MALPVSPPPKSDDVAVHGWAGITIRVAWTLLSAGVKVRPEVLAAARRHAILHLAPSTPLPQAEDRAGQLTRRFIAMARGKELDDPWPSDAEMPLTDRWARKFNHIKDRLSLAVFRLHYGDARSLSYVEEKLGADRIAVEAARGGLREVLRRMAREDGLPLDAWSAERLDRVLTRLSAWAPDQCPPTYDVVNGAHRTHVRACPRCNRMDRLVKAEVLDANDLQAPTLRARPRGDLDLLVIHLHPDARPHLAPLIEALPVGAKAMGEDVVVVDIASSQDQVHRILQIAAELGRPTRHHIRAARVQGPGEWTTFGPLGPLARSGIGEVRTRAWGTVDGLGTLPERLPEPPSASRVWGVAGMLVATALIAIGLAVVPATAQAPEAQATFLPSGAGIWVSFDVPDAYEVALVSEVDGVLQVALAGDGAAEKVGLAVGDGSFRGHLPGSRVLLVTAPDLDLATQIEHASRAPRPFDTLYLDVRRTLPDAHVFTGSQ